MSAVGRIARPDTFANIERRHMYKHIGIAGGTSIILGIIYHYFYEKPWVQKHHDFYATYNPWEEFERMRNLGLFESCPPDYILKEREEALKAKKKK